jgi:hypothetical protein
MAADFVVRGLFYGIRWARGTWQSKRVIGD